MKLATYRDGSRDGQLVVVSRDLALAHHASGIASRLQQVLDDWNFLSPQLEDLSATLNAGKARHAFAFDPRCCLAPLPRAFQWVLAGAAAGDEPLQHPSDALLGPQDEALLPAPRPGLQLQAGFAVLTGDLPRHATPSQALERVRLIVLAHVWRVPAGAQPAGALAPLAVTPDELGSGWRDGRVRLALRCQPVFSGPGADPGGDPAALPSPDFASLLAQVARVRPVPAGSIVGPRVAPVSAEPAAAPEGQDGCARSDAWPPAGTVHSEATGPDGSSVFGALAQRFAFDDGAGSGS